MGITQLVDPPGPFDTLATWVSYRKTLDKMPADEFRTWLIEEADQTISQKKAEKSHRA